MIFFNEYNENVVQYDLINKFSYKKVKQIPKLKSITLSFKAKKYDLHTLLSCLSALDLLSFQKPVLNFSRISNISLKIRKGQPIGCKVTLRKKKLNKFLIILLNKYHVKTTSNITEHNKSFLSHNITNVLIFNNLEKNYQYFKNLSDLNVNISTSNCCNKELSFLLMSNKLLR